MSDEMKAGTVKFFNTTKGFGFVQPEDGGGDVFVHITALQRSGIQGLNEGDGKWKEELPLSVQASAHNYNHLLEQPTIFYALMFYITLTSQMSSVQTHAGFMM